MDLAKEIEIILRDAGFETWPWSDGPIPVVCFESEVILGFVHLFDSVHNLREDWKKSQDATLARFKPALRNAGEKAWNVYSIFLTEQEHDESSPQYLDYIEEDFRQTRKIARDGIASTDGLVNALLPLLPIRNRPIIDESNFYHRLQERFEQISTDGATAFLKGASPTDIAQILAEKQ